MAAIAAVLAPPLPDPQPISIRSARCGVVPAQNSPVEDCFGGSHPCCSGTWMRPGCVLDAFLHVPRCWWWLIGGRGKACDDYLVLPLVLSPIPFSFKVNVSPQQLSLFLSLSFPPPTRGQPAHKAPPSIHISTFSWPSMLGPTVRQRYDRQVLEVEKALLPPSPSPWRRNGHVGLQSSLPNS